MNRRLLQTVLLAALVGTPPAPRPDTPAASEDEDFTTHLDRCPQCRNHPFGLCVTGEKLLRRAAEEA